MSGSQEVWAQTLIRSGFALCMLGMLCSCLPAARRFFGTADRSGYLDANPFLKSIFGSLGRPIHLTVWLASAVSLLIGQQPVLSATVCLFYCRLCFVSMRWRGISRGMGAPGFMLYWLSGLVFFLEYTSAYDPSGVLRTVALLAFKVDFAMIFLCAGQYKFFSGYPQGNGAECGLVNPSWGRFHQAFARLSPRATVFKCWNHGAYIGELLLGLGLLIPQTSVYSAVALGTSFLLIALHLRLGVLCYTVSTCCILFVIPTTASTDLEKLGLMNGGLAAVLIAYLFFLLPTKFGLYYNFYAKRRLPEKWQRFQDRWSNFWGIIIWRVFTQDNTNFFVRIYLQDRESGQRRLYRDASRFSHVCEQVTVTCVFTSLRYFSPGSSVFTDRLRRYARSIPCGENENLVFEWVDIVKAEDRFEYRSAREFVWDSRLELVSQDLSFRVSDTAADRFSNLVEGAEVGSYAPS